MVEIVTLYTVAGEYFREKAAAQESFLEAGRAADTYGSACPAPPTEVPALKVGNRYFPLTEVVPQQ